MSPDWLKQERRSYPTAVETAALNMVNLQAISERVEENRLQLKENTRLLIQLEYKMDDLEEHFKAHTAESQLVLDNFKLTKGLRTLAAGAFFTLIALVAFFKDGLDIVKHWIK